MPTSTGVHKKHSEDLCSLLKTIRKNPDFNKAGAIATFTGIVRGENSKGEKVEKLELEAYEEKANEVLMKICNDLKKKYRVLNVQIHHLLGEFSVGEDIVYVLVAGSHRKEVFTALEEAVERYKKETPIFKKEYVKSAKGGARCYWTEEDERNKQRPC